MILDKETTLWDAAALTTGTTVSTNTFDMEVDTRDIGIGEPMALFITVDVAADSTTGDEAHTFNVIQSAAENLGSATVIATAVFTAAQVAAGALAAGRQVIIPIPPERITQRYLGGQHIGAGTTATITITAWIAPLNFGRTREKFHPVGYTIAT